MSTELPDARCRTILEFERTLTLHLDVQRPGLGFKCILGQSESDPMKDWTRSGSANSLCPSLLIALPGGSAIVGARKIAFISFCATLGGRADVGWVF
jgi:hypothetical protein